MRAPFVRVLGAIPVVEFLGEKDSGFLRIWEWVCGEDFAEVMRRE